MMIDHDQQDSMVSTNQTNKTKILIIFQKKTTKITLVGGIFSALLSRANFSNLVIRFFRLVTCGARIIPAHIPTSKHFFNRHAEQTCRLFTLISH